MKRIRSAARRREGFSLVEMMIAMVVLGFGLLGMLMMQAKAMDSSTQGRESSSALAVVRNAFEQVPRIPFSTMPADDTWKAPAWIQNPGLLPGDPVLPNGVVGERVTAANGTDSFHQLYRVWYRVSADPSPTPDARVRSVEVEVIWDDDNDIVVTPDTRTGERFIRLSGLIFDNDL